VPSEVTALTWKDVCWERERFTVRSVKTARHDGKGSRVVPIFPELVGPFREAFEAAEPGAVYCCPQYPTGTAGQHYRKVILRALARAGVEPWEKIVGNLRATRASELVERFPAHVAAAWLGHSPEIARRHYLMVTQDHFQKAAQKAAQQKREMPEMACNDHQEEAVAGVCTDIHTTKYPQGDSNPCPRDENPIS